MRGGGAARGWLKPLVGALQRDAALFFEGTSGMSMRECTVTRVDGNAVMLSGFNRGAVIADNEFTWIGDSVIASWGHTKEVDGVEGNDGTNGEQPRGTQIVRNLVHENGFFSKQASPYFQAKAAQTLLADNIFFNGPRAGVNINDGFGGPPQQLALALLLPHGSRDLTLRCFSGGGNELRSNLIFNYCRESSDHVQPSSVSLPHPRRLSANW